MLRFWTGGFRNQVVGNLETVQGSKRVGKSGIRKLEAINTSSICACYWIE